MKKILLSLAATVIALIASEIGLRILEPELSMYQEGGNSVYRLKPGYRNASREINSLGFRNPEFGIQKTPGKKRILFIGDSFTFGATPSAQSFPRQFEAMSGEGGDGCEAINAGVPGYSTVHEYYFLKDHCGSLGADTVVLSIFVGNDIEENAVFHDVEKEGVYLISTRMRSREKGLQKIIALFHRSRIISLVKNRFFSYESLVDRNIDSLISEVLRRYMNWHRHGIFDDTAFAYNLKGFYNTLHGKQCSEKNSLAIAGKIAEWSAAAVTDAELIKMLSGILSEGLSGQEQTERAYSRAVYLAVQLKHTDIYFGGTLEKGWSGTAGALGKIRDLCAERGQQLFVLIIPDETQLKLTMQQEVVRFNLDRKEPPDFELPQKKLKVMLEGLGIEYMDILPLFRQEGGSCYLQHNTHCNSIGNSIIALAVLELSES